MSVEEAVKTAIDYVQRLFSGQDFRLEEVQLQDDGSWDVTVSFHPLLSSAEDLRAQARSNLDPSGRTAVGIDLTRMFKVVQVSKEGEVKAVRMRPIVVG